MSWPTKPNLYNSIYNEASRLKFTTDQEKSQWIVREYVVRGGKYYWQGRVKNENQVQQPIPAKKDVERNPF